MTATVRWAWVVVLLSATPASAQTSTGAIAGLVVDRTGTALAGARVRVVALDTGLARTAVTTDEGQFTVALLPPGAYRVDAEDAGRRSPIVRADVLAGAVTSVDLVADAAMTDESLTVSPGLRRRDDHHGIGGWVTRQDIEAQPLNGRTVLELAKLEPGVLPPERLPGGRVFIAPLGAGLPTIPRVGFTRVTVDGANIETPGTVGTLLQVSPEVVDQLHVATVNFDASTGLATSGAVNIITRAGTNQVRGGAFSLYRDAGWSAYPIESPGAVEVDPSFRRYQAGGTIGGPLRRDRLFGFAAFERHDQRDRLVVTPVDPYLQPLGGSFGSPYRGTLVTGRLDMRISDRHRVFVRHLLDRNSAVTISDSPSALPSGWTDQPVLAAHTLAAWTQVVGSALVHEVRASYYSVNTAFDPIERERCEDPCFGFGSPRITISDGAGDAVTLGVAGSTHLRSHRIQLSESIAWQRGAHDWRGGVDWEYTRHANYALSSTPVQMTLWAPATALERNPGLAIPTTFQSLADVLALPLRSFQTSVGSGEILQRDFRPERDLHMFRLHVGDRWRLHPRVTLNAGLAWAIEPHVLNDDLRKPAWLGPLLGDRFRVPARHASLSGLAGFSWRVDDAGRTIVRAGGGRYAESVARTVLANLNTERVELSPLGAGRITASGTNLFHSGLRLDFPAPTPFTGADLLSILPDIRANLALSLDPGNRDYSVVNLDRSKEGRNLYDPDYRTPSAVHASVGIERVIAGGLTVSADVTYKRFAHTFINGIDYNRFFAADGPVIRACLPGERFDVTAACSNGSLFFDTTSGRARYLGLLTRVEQRFGGDGWAVVSYAIGRLSGTNGTGTGTSENPAGRVFGFNNDDWLDNDGPLPTDHRHVLNIAGTWNGPWGLQVSGNLSAYDRPPFSAYVGGMDFNGDGTRNDLLPGTTVNAFNRGLSARDLPALIAGYNEMYAGRPTAGGQVAPTLVLPEEFSLYDNFVTLDLRLGRTFRLRPDVSLTFFVDIFNVFDTDNFTGHGSNLAAPLSFGQPSNRVGQAFGSGGPRAAQLGLRVAF